MWRNLLIFPVIAFIMLISPANASASTTLNITRTEYGTADYGNGYLQDNFTFFFTPKVNTILPPNDFFNACDFVSSTFIYTNVVWDNDASATESSCTFVRDGPYHTGDEIMRGTDYNAYLRIRENNNNDIIAQSDNFNFNYPIYNQITDLSPAKFWLSKNLLNIGVKFDLKAEVYKDSTLVSSGQISSVTAGSGGFNNATLETIPFNSFSPIDFPTGSQLKIKVYARNACSGSLLNSGTAKLWYNTTAANSSFDATLGGANNNYYLLNSFLLGTSAGSGPQQSISVAAGAKCSPFKSFGTWSITP